MLIKRDIQKKKLMTKLSNSKNQNARKIDETNIDDFMKTISEEEVETEVGIDNFTPNDKLMFVD